ncbi:cyclase family protein [Nocardioides humi]|uniref:cyclase family protein n=1 Tax=Nocardioides humi TaxID=449461 RepID=UPI002482138B|nr:cyclase family protein [Nocardioides humi]
MVATHGTTHIDALAHVWREGAMWNGHSSNLVTSIGARKCGIENVGAIVTRAVLVDFADQYEASGDPRHAIDVDDLSAAVAATGIDVMPGDALLVRTGWVRAWRSQRAQVTAWPGLAPNCAEWINEAGFALVGADNIAVELGPSPRENDAAPLHARLVRDFGIYLVELLDLEAIAAQGRSSFLLSIAPMPLVGGSEVRSIQSPYSE